MLYGVKKIIIFLAIVSILCLLILFFYSLFKHLAKKQKENEKKERIKKLLILKKNITNTTLTKTQEFKELTKLDKNFSLDSLTHSNESTPIFNNLIHSNDSTPVFNRLTNYGSYSYQQIPQENEISECSPLSTKIMKFVTKPPLSKSHSDQLINKKHSVDDICV